MTTKNKKKEAVSMRHEMELRQLNGLMMMLGLAAVFQPLAGTVSHISPDGATVTEGIPFASFIGGLCVISIGFLSVFIGFSKVVFNWHSVGLTFFSLFWVQTSWIPYITGMVNVGKIARSGMGFIPEDYDPTPVDVKVVGACGILAILAYGFCFIGSISFTQFAFYAHLKGMVETRSGDYFRKRSRIYCYLLFQAGLAQAGLGGYLAYRFDALGALHCSPISVAMLFVSYPLVSVAVGGMQMILGLFGIARSFDVLVFGDFGKAMFFAWVVQVTLHVLFQVGIVPGAGAVGAAPTITGFSVGLNLMPAYLDWKSRTLPSSIPYDYYLPHDTDLSDDDDDDDEKSVEFARPRQEQPRVLPPLPPQAAEPTSSYTGYTGPEFEYEA